MPGCEPWPIVWPCPTDTVDPVLVDMAQSLSAQLLWAMSGYRIGRCEYTEAFVMAVEGGCGFPYKDRNGNWRNNGQSGGACCRVLLTNRPVAAITEVVDGGVVLAPTDYRLEGSWLRRRGECWTTTLACEDPELIVTYQAGVPFPPGTPAVMGEVACEYLTALQGDTCRLPSRAVSISRQGVTVTLDSISEFVSRRRLGLPITDAWLDSVATGPRIGSRVYSPDLARGIRQ